MIVTVTLKDPLETPDPLTMSHPRIQEVSDDDSDDIVAQDPDEMDPDAFDFAQPQKGTLGSTAPGSQMSPDPISAMPNPGPHAPSPPSDADRDRALREQQQRTRHYQCLYPVYFDATRSRAQGRRVRAATAVANPLARDLVDAVRAAGAQLGVALALAFEPLKTHPRDWANPGRVRVLVKHEGRPVHPRLANKHQLYGLVAAYLCAHPTTAESPLRLRLMGLPVPADGKAPEPAVPRGFRMGRILPLHSPALSGGGVNENFLTDMMAGMGGQAPPGMEGMANMLGGGGGGASAPSGATKKVKDKKKK